MLLMLMAFVIIACEGTSDSDTNSGTSGQSGSLASMVVAGDQLHILNNDKVISFELSAGMALQEGIKGGYFWNADTLSNYQDKYLLIGTDTGVIVYDFVNQQEVSTVNHIVARDPVVAEGVNGYFTTCDSNPSFGSARDTVNIMDLTNVENTTLTFTTNELPEPYGLAIYEDELYVCDQSVGLSRFNIVKDEEGKATELEYISSNINLPCNDIIIRDELVILIDSNGATQFTWDAEELTILSEIY